MLAMNKLFKTNLAEIKPYTSGKPIEEVLRENKVKGIIKLASNENPLGPSPKALAALRRAINSVHFYPEKKAPQLRQAIAKKLGISTNNIIIGNGSDEVMQFCAAATIAPGDEVIIADCTFSVYELVTRMFCGTPIFVPLSDYTFDLEAILERITPQTKLIFIANPNSPTGTIIKKQPLEQFLNKIPAHVLVVLDEAYAEYVEAKDYPAGLDYLNTSANIVILRTFSKIYGLAGLRIGYGIARPDIITQLNAVRLPFNCNRIAQVSAAAALSDSSFVKKSLANNRAGKKFLYQELDQLGLKYLKTEANFIAIFLTVAADVLASRMLEYGVIVRPLTSFGLTHAIRVTIGTPAENRRFIKVLKKALKC